MYCISTNSGTDALYLSLKALGIGIGDEVITSSHTFKATVGAIINAGAKPVLVDIGEDGLIDPDKIEEKITKKTKAIIPVHIAGAICDLGKIRKIAEKYNLFIINDSAQALGAKGITNGDVSCFSFYPAKILGAYGDAGAITTNDYKIYEYIKEARNHFKTDNRDFGINSRMDNLQAAFLNVKIKHINEILKRRKEIAELYLQGLKEIDGLPKNTQGRVWQDFIFNAGKERESLYNFLKKEGAETIRNEYPFSANFPKLPLAAEYEASTLRLPCNENLEDYEVEEVTKKIKAFYDQ